MPRAIVLGGGIAGLTAAHELAERGFEVHLYEARSGVGGKARSIPVPGTGVEGRRSLPGEHGFRFFPGFYRHLDDTMARIPFGSQRRGVLDNLVDTTRMAVVHPERPMFVNIARFPRSLDDLKTALRATLRAEFDARPGELLRFAELLWCVGASCQARREATLDDIPVTLAARSEGASEGFQELVGLTQIFVALRAEEISTKTAATVALRMYTDLLRPTRGSDRVLNGPTSDAFLEPWREHLLRLGVRLHMGSPVRRLRTAEGRLAGVEVGSASGARCVQGDYYVLAVPVEVAAALADRDLLRADPALENLRRLAQSTRWMVGIQYFLRGDYETVHGHIIHMRSPWALTSVFHDRFWRPEAMATLGDGTVRTVLSVDISDWDTPGLNGRPARECTPEEIRDEVWAELCAGLARDGRTCLRRSDLVAWQLDPGFLPRSATGPATHDEPLFANVAGTWALRPTAETALPNLFLAGDYVRTVTDLASMEGANEAARRAVNGVLRRAGSAAPPCALFQGREPALLAPLRWLDRLVHRAGLPFLLGRWPRRPAPVRAPLPVGEPLELGEALAS